jgi:S1-C subfamily serine protease
MSRPFTTLALLVAFSISNLAAPLTGWPLVAEKVRDSIVYIQVDEGSSCTGFAINTAKSYVLTAAHCEGKEMLVDQIPAKLVAKDQKRDLMVLEVKDLDRPALKLAPNDVHVGDAVASFGFGYGLDKPLFRVTHVSATDLHITEIGGPFLIVDAAFAPGQSGGPVVNSDGEVVMIVQLANEITGIGVSGDTIRDRMGRYFEK